MPHPESRVEIPNSIKAVIFDLDGTLLDTEALSDYAILDAFGSSLPAEARRKLDADGGILPWELKKRILGLRGSEWIPMVIEYARERWGVGVDPIIPINEFGNGLLCDHALSPVPSVDDFWKNWEGRLNELCGEVEACKGARLIVEELDKAAVPLAIATSSRLAAVEKKRVKHEEMFRRIPIIVCGDDPKVRNGKPAPDIYIEAAERLGVKPCECLVFEDGLSGCLSAKRAGCHVVAVPDARMDRNIFVSAADEVLNNLLEFNGRRWGLGINMSLVHSVDENEEK